MKPTPPPGRLLFEHQNPWPRKQAGFFGLDTIFEAIAKFFAMLIDGARALGKAIIEHPRIAAAILVALILAYGGWRVKSHINDLNDVIVTQRESIVALTAQNVQLVEDVKTAKGVNDSNKAVIDKLTVDKRELNRIISDLRGQGMVSNKRLDELQGMIDNMKPEDNGTVAKVLKDTVDGIISERKTREGKFK